MTLSGNSESRDSAQDGDRPPRQIYYVRLDPPQSPGGTHLPSTGGTPARPVRTSDSAGNGVETRPNEPPHHSAETSTPREELASADGNVCTETVPAAHTDTPPLSPPALAPPPPSPPPLAPPPLLPLSVLPPPPATSTGETVSAAATAPAALAATGATDAQPRPDAVERIRRQARELAAHLRARRQAVNRRRQEASEQISLEQAEIARRVAAVQQREEQLDQHQEFVDQLKAEATALHQEALETRLATEQLWAKMADREEMPTILARVAELKRRLVDQHRNTLTVIARQQEALQRSADQLDRRQSELRKQRDELQAWVLRRHEELEQQRLQLIAREQELDAQERARQEIHSRVEGEILGYQRQIRQLSAQLRCKQELGRLRDSA